MTTSDLSVLTWPGVMVDQYGWGHTGTVDGALACAWVLEGGRTVVAATVSGRSPSTGGDVCDLVVPAVAGDLGIGRGIPRPLPTVTIDYGQDCSTGPTPAVLSRGSSVGGRR